GDRQLDAPDKPPGLVEPKGLVARATATEKEPGLRLFLRVRCCKEEERCGGQANDAERHDDPQRLGPIPRSITGRVTHAHHRYNTPRLDAGSTLPGRSDSKTAPRSLHLDLAPQLRSGLVFEDLVVQPARVLDPTHPQELAHRLHSPLVACVGPERVEVRAPWSGTGLRLQRGHLALGRGEVAGRHRVTIRGKGILPRRRPAGGGRSSRFTL